MAGEGGGVDTEAPHSLPTDAKLSTRRRVFDGACKRIHCVGTYSTTTNHNDSSFDLKSLAHETESS